MKRLEELAARYELPPSFAASMAAVLTALETEVASLTTVRDPRAGADVHVADSLVALDVPPVRDARRIADLGSGAGFPGLVLAVALPGVELTLVESVHRKTEWLRRAAALAGVDRRVDVITARAEAWKAGIGTCDVVTARALAPLTALVEYAAPLLRDGGVLVAYKGRRDADEEADGAAAARLLGLELVEIRAVTPFPDSGARHLHVYAKVAPTPEGYPRREGMARKRPITAAKSG